MKLDDGTRTPKILGYLGLIPFIVPASLMYFDDQHHFAFWGYVLMSYGALILTFVGALQWAFAMTLSDLSMRQRKWMYGWSVVPSLVAWGAMLMSPMVAFLLIAIFMAFALWMDAQLGRLVSLPNWYLPLRIRLTTVAILSLTGALFLNFR